MNNQKPELIKLMRKTQKPLVDFYTFLQALGARGIADHGAIRVASAVKAEKPHLRALEYFGITSEPRSEHVIFRSGEYPDIFPARRPLSIISAGSASDSIFIFSHCLFDTGRDYLIEMLGGFHASPTRSLAAFDRHLSQGQRTSCYDPV